MHVQNCNDKAIHHDSDWTDVTHCSCRRPASEANAHGGLPKYHAVAQHPEERPSFNIHRIKSWIYSWVWERLKRRGARHSLH